MGKVYVMHNNGVTTEMKRIRCKNEDLELQSILEGNPDLLPGDQINPDDPRRWILIKREMPVPNPGTGIDQWSVDFVFADQDAILTFVECKRFADTRSRREIVGQMLEYAANGHYYWDKEILRRFAEESAAIQQKQSLEELVINHLKPNTDDTVEDFFEHIQQNLREGQLRIIFFLEESPFELRSIVDFLNKQMERSEVLLVEARQYEHEGTRIVVPMLFGYTEEARLVKRLVTVSNVSKAINRKQWDESTFFAVAKETLNQHDFEAVQKLYRGVIDLGLQIGWGTGQTAGTFTVKEPSICKRSLVVVATNGILNTGFGWLNGDENAGNARDDFKNLVTEKLGFTLPHEVDKKFPKFSIKEWGSKVDLLLEIFKFLTDKYRTYQPN